MLFLLPGTLIEFIVKNCRHRCIYHFGDLNVRFATPLMRINQYSPNPDNVINSYGRRLIKICVDNNMTFKNDLIYLHRRLDTDFTFFRDTLKSQNDWCKRHS